MSRLFYSEHAPDGVAVIKTFFEESVVDVGVVVVGLVEGLGGFNSFTEFGIGGRNWGCGRVHEVKVKNKLGDSFEQIFKRNFTGVVSEWNDQLFNPWRVIRV